MEGLPEAALGLDFIAAGELKVTPCLSAPFHGTPSSTRCKLPVTSPNLVTNQQYSCHSLICIPIHKTRFLSVITPAIAALLLYCLFFSGNLATCHCVFKFVSPYNMPKELLMSLINLRLLSFLEGLPNSIFSFRLSMIFSAFSLKITSPLSIDVSQLVYLLSMLNIHTLVYV